MAAMLTDADADASSLLLEVEGPGVVDGVSSRSCDFGLSSYGSK